MVRIPRLGQDRGQDLRGRAYPSRPSRELEARPHLQQRTDVDRDGLSRDGPLPVLDRRGTQGRRVRVQDGARATPTPAAYEHTATRATADDRTRGAPHSRRRAAAREPFTPTHGRVDSPSEPAGQAAPLAHQPASPSRLIYFTIPSIA